MSRPTKRSKGSRKRNRKQKKKKKVNRGLTAEIDLHAAAFNLSSIVRAVNGLPVIAVVKADAYGHGAVELSRVFRDSGASALAVALVSEARELRDAGIETPILVLFDRTETAAYLDLGLTPVIHDLGTAEAFSREAGKRNRGIDVHLKVDTGMGRMGIGSKGEVAEILGLPNIRVAGLLSHFSEADLEDMDFMRQQLRGFNAIKEMLLKEGLNPLCHMANSAAVISYADSHLDAVRPGLILYGCLPFEDQRSKDAPPLRPLMKVKAEILALRRLKPGQPVSYSRTFVTKRETLAAVIAAGYADGYPRSFSNRSHVLINGRKAPVLGRVCMDLTVVDATDVGDVNEHDEAVLLGAEKGGAITAWELAREAATIPYEVLIWLGMHSRRAYRGMGD
jgi:alanine racemase